MPDANGKPLRADANTPNPVLTNKTYDLVKDFVIVVFPAAILLYSGLGVLLGWPDVEKYVAALGLIGTFLGVLLKVAAKRYEKLPVDYDGEFVVNDPNPDNETFRFDFNNSLPTMAGQETVRLKVVDLLPNQGE